MAKRLPADTEELMKRAHADRQPEMAGKEHRYVYNGDVRGPSFGYAVRPNRKAVRRTVSVFNVILSLFGLAISIVLYIANFITVNQLAAEIGQLQAEYDQIQSVNAGLRADITRKSAWERIGTRATLELGLQHSRQQPLWIDIDREKLERATGD